jgi:hypothetical protein
MLIAEHRAELVLYDRFPLGQDDGAPRTIWGRMMLGYTKFFRSVLPSPDLVILLDGDDHVIWSRKREMPFASHQATQARYREFVASQSAETAIVRTDGQLSTALRDLQHAMAVSRSIQHKFYGPRSVSQALETTGRATDLP